MRLANKVALITGASRGIGAAIAKAFAAAGTTVLLNYRESSEQAEAVLRDIEAVGGRGLVLEGDVILRPEVDRMIDTVARTVGTVDILVNNAHRAFAPKRFLDLTWDDILQQVDGTLRSAFNCTQAVLPGMLTKRWGRIINIGSVSVDQPEPGFHSRDIAKAGLLGLSRNLALEVAAAGVTVNVLSPGWTLTDQAASFPEDMKNRALDRTPLGRLARPEDIAGAAVFLASDEARHVTGICLPVCGGSLMK